MVNSVMRKAVLLLLLVSCHLPSTRGQNQGIKGQVFWIGENKMPSEDVKKSPHHGVQRELLIYELTKLDEVTREGVFFSAVKSKLVLRITTKKDGSYKVRLPEGRYSVFVREPNGLYANLFEKDGSINPITVKSKNYSWLTITIDYQAAY